MSYQEFENGLYLASRATNKYGGLAQHFAVIDVGDVLGYSHFRQDYPVVYHLVYPQLETEPLSGEWHILGKAEDLFQAKQRFLYALNNPQYDFLNNNCEQFARYVVSGKRYSGQLIGVGVVLTAALVIAIGSAVEKTQKDERWPSGR